MHFLFFLFIFDFDARFFSYLCPEYTMNISTTIF